MDSSGERSAAMLGIAFGILVMVLIYLISSGNWIGVAVAVAVGVGILFYARRARTSGLDTR